MTALVQIDNLVVKAATGSGPETTLLDGIDLALAAGEIVGVVGASGSGKSTLGLALAGYTRPGVYIASGRILFDDQDLRCLSPERLRRLRGREIAYVPQSAQAAFNPALTIGSQVVEGPILRGELAKSEADEFANGLYATFRLPQPETFGQNYPHQVSGGQLQRASAAMAFAGHPKLIVFDEPTTALDVTTQVEVLAAFRAQLRLQRVAALYISHDLAVVAQLVDRIIVMDRGRIVDDGDVRSILGQRSNGRTPTGRPSRPTAMHSQLLLVAHDLSLQYKNRPSPALSGVNLHIGKGEVVGLIGESGSGKSTLARVLAGLTNPDTGRVEFEGEPLPAAIRDRPPALRRRIQIAFQSADVSLNPRQKVADILGRPLSLFQGLSGSALGTATRELLEEVGLPPEVAQRYPAQLSGGQKQRINLARALAAKPDLIICDEVTSALDADLRDSIIELLERLRSGRNMALLFITHDLSTVANFADRIVVLHRGEVVEEGQAQQVFEQSRHPYTADLVSAIPSLETGWLDAAIARHLSGSGLPVTDTDSPRAFGASGSVVAAARPIAQQLPPAAIAAPSPNLQQSNHDIPDPAFHANRRQLRKA